MLGDREMVRDCLLREDEVLVRRLHMLKMKRTVTVREKDGNIGLC